MRTNYSKFLISLVSIIALSQTAFAKRYIVVYKSQQGLKAMNSYMQLENNSGVEFERSLNNVNSMVIKADQADAAMSLMKHPEVATVEEEVFRPLPKPMSGFKLSTNDLERKKKRRYRPDNDAPSAGDNVPSFVEGAATPWGIKAVNAPQAWASAKAGAQARVLVLDTGIDPEHPALAKNFEKGRNFFESDTGLDTEDFIDKEGHGTHVAGTVAASYNEQTGFTGVAPLTKILMGRVCGDLGCSNIAVAEGINWGIDSKVDVITMSLGGPFSTSAEKNAIANAEKAGVSVIAASGNDGTAKVSFPAAYATVIAVGAVDSSIKKTAFSQWGPQLDIVAPGAAVISSVPQGSGRESIVEIVINGNKSSVKSAAFSGTSLFTTAQIGELVPAGLGKPEDFVGLNLEGKFALISRGEIAFVEKVKNALKAKATGVVIYNNTDGLMQGVASDGAEVTVPVIMIEKTVGLGLVDQISKGAKVGAEVLTTASNYASFDGTSMATPHVAGVVALMKSANKKLTPEQVRMILAKTAVAVLPNDQNQTGAGMIQADKAVQMAISAIQE